MSAVKHPSQARIVKAVRGAVYNAAHAHPEWRFDPRFAQSVAKRAAGTLTAEWPEVLAARLARRQQRNTELRDLDRSSRGRLSHRLQALQGQPPLHSLKLLWRSISAHVGPAKKAGQTERAETLIEVLRMIAEMQKRS